MTFRLFHTYNLEKLRKIAPLRALAGWRLAYFYRVGLGLP
jgi:hypothetical protein